MIPLLVSLYLSLNREPPFGGSGQGVDGEGGKQGCILLSRWVRP